MFQLSLVTMATLVAFVGAIIRVARNVAVHVAAQDGAVAMGHWGVHSRHRAMEM